MSQLQKPGELSFWGRELVKATLADSDIAHAMARVKEGLDATKGRGKRKEVDYAERRLHADLIFRLTGAYPDPRLEIDGQVVAFTMLGLDRGKV